MRVSTAEAHDPYAGAMAFRTLSLISLLALIACGDDDAALDASSDTGRDTAVADTGSEDTAPDDTGTDTGPEDMGTDTAVADTGAGDTGSDTGTADVGTDAGLEECIFGGPSCGPERYCDFPRGSCGADDARGVCRERPVDCPDVDIPTCGCDGVVHGNGCEAHAAGTDESDVGGCEAPDETSFSCGRIFCQDTSFCRRLGDDTGMADSFECPELPAACDDEPDCECLDGAGCGDACSADEAGNLTVVCFGG